jgi:hypothetical protein
LVARIPSPAFRYCTIAHAKTVESGEGILAFPTRQARPCAADPVARGAGGLGATQGSLIPFQRKVSFRHGRSTNAAADLLWPREEKGQWPLCQKIK